MEKNEQTLLESGIITTDVPKDKDRTDDGNMDEMVAIILCNDPVTLCDYVTFCLVQIDFGLTYREAKDTMWHAHFHGQSIVGHYPRGLAQRLLDDVMRLNFQCHQYPQFVIN